MFLPKKTWACVLLSKNNDIAIHQTYGVSQKQNTDESDKRRTIMENVTIDREIYQIYPDLKAEVRNFDNLEFLDFLPSFPSED